jgi:tetratricopeptide (TPR) repeat protein
MMSSLLVLSVGIATLVSSDTPALAEPEPPPLQSTLWEAARYPRSGTYAQALDRAERALAQSPLTAQDRAAARLAIGTALRLQPDRPEAYVLHGQLCLAERSFRQAADAYAQARRLDPWHRTRFVQHRFAVASALAGDHVAAADAFTRLPRPGDPPRMVAILLGNAAESSLAAGQLGRAITLFRQAGAADGGYAAPLFGLAVALHRDGHPVAGVAAMKVALRRDPKREALEGPHAVYFPSSSRHYYLALAAEAEGRTREAQTAWRAFLAAEPRGPWVTQARAALERLERPAPALPRPGLPRPATAAPVRSPQ